MASFFKNMMSKFRQYEEDEYGYDEMEMQADREMAFEPTSLVEERPMTERQSMRVVDFRNNGQGHQVMIVYPNHIEAAQTISRHIQAGRTVICNFEKCEAFSPQRILDFINGAAFALGGSVKAISSNIFMVAPPNVSVMSGQEQTESTMSYARRA